MSEIHESPQRQFRPYPEYRDSGVDWLGEIPAHWCSKRLRFVTHTSPPKSEVRSVAGDTLVSFVPMESVGEYGGLELRASRPIDTVREGYTYFRNGDVLVAKITPCFENGKGALAEGLEAGIGFGTTELHVLRPSNDLDGRFLFYLTLSDHFRRIGASEMYGAGGQKRVPEEFIRNLHHPLPELNEQRAIATFLDRESGEINALVVKKERLIEPLQEKRTALITRAVTKGLDPDVPMRDSGVEWLDQLPRHWTGLPLKRWVATKITDGPHETPQFEDEGIQFISAEAISDGKIDFDRRWGFISQELHEEYSRKCKPVRGDILVCKSGATTGKLAMVEVDLGFSVWSPLALVRADRSRLLPRFLAMALGSEYVQGQVRRTWSAGTQPNISMGDLEMLFVVAPSIEEQAEILEYLGGEIDGFGTLLSKIREGVERLKEFRTALISAAVTGKIDARGKAA